MRWNIIIPVLIILVVMSLAYATENPNNPQYNQTSHKVTSEGILEFEHTSNGFMKIRSQGKLKGNLGFGLSGYIGGDAYKKLSSDFDWTWWNETVIYNVTYPYWDDEANETINITEEWKNITLYGYNNRPNFQWLQTWHFTPNKPVKITHQIRNNLAPVSNLKLWYINTLKEGSTISYHNRSYTVNADDFIHLQGDYLNRVVPRARINYDYTFDYEDLLDEYNITDVIIGNFRDYFNLDNDLILLGVGVTKNNGNFGVGETWTLDPTVTSWLSPNDYGYPDDDWTNGTNILDSDDNDASSNTVGHMESISNYSISSAVPDGSDIHGMEVRIEGTGGAGGIFPAPYASIAVYVSGDAGNNYIWGDKSHSVGMYGSDNDNFYTLGALIDSGFVNWTGTNLTDENFRVKLGISALKDGGEARVDHVEIRLNYTSPPLEMDYVFPTPDDEDNVSAMMTINATSNNDLSSCILQYNHSGSWANKTMTIFDDDRGCWTTLTRLNNVNFSFNIYGEDTDSHINITTTRNIHVQNHAPTLTVQTPLNNTFYYLNNTLINFTISDEEDDLKRISVFLSNDSSNVDKNSILYYDDEALNGTYDFNFTVLPARMEDKVYAMYHLDKAGIWGENNSFIYDHSGHGYDGEIVSGTTEPTFDLSGKIAGAYEFDGINDIIVLGNSLDDFWDWCNGTNTNHCAVSAWIYLKNNAMSTIVSRYRSVGDNQFLWFFYYHTTSALNFRIGRDGTGAGDLCGASGDFSSYLNKWTHIIGQYNGTDTFVYANGNLLGTTTCSFSGLDFDAWQDNEETQVGKFSAGAYFNGTIDEVVFWNDTLTSSEMDNLYSEKAGRYYWNINVSDADDSVDEEDLEFTLGSTCVYSGSGDWNIDCGEGCSMLNTNVVVDGSNWILSGEGIYTVASGINVTGWGNLTVRDNCDLIGYDPVQWLGF